MAFQRRAGGSCISSRDCLPTTVGVPYAQGKRPPKPKGPEHVSDEEVQRVTDALDEIERIADPEARVRAKSRIMAEQVLRNRDWAEERKGLIRHMHQEEQLSYRQIAARLEIKLSTVQDAFRSYTGSGRHRPKTEKPTEKPVE